MAVSRMPSSTTTKRRPKWSTVRKAASGRGSVAGTAAAFRAKRRDDHRVLPMRRREQVRWDVRVQDNEKSLLHTGRVALLPGWSTTVPASVRQKALFSHGCSRVVNLRHRNQHRPPVSLSPELPCVSNRSDHGRLCGAQDRLESASSRTPRSGCAWHFSESLGDRLSA